MVGLKDRVYDGDLAQPSMISVELTAANTDYTQGVARGLYIGGVGDVTIMNPDGSTCTFQDVPAGTILPVMSIQLRTATTATNVVGLF
jgi:hypothetical protein